MCKLEGYKCSLSVKSKWAAHNKHMKRMSDSLLQILWKNNSRSLSSSSFISSSFLVCFEWFKTRCVHQLGVYKRSLHSRGKDTMIQDLKHKIKIYFNSPIIEHWAPLHQTPHILPIPLLNWEIFAALESLGEELQIFLSFRIKGTMCEDSTLFDFLSVCSLDYLPYPISKGV
jgi:hypothetical protein